MNQSGKCLRREKFLEVGRHSWKKVAGRTKRRRESTANGVKKSAKPSRKKLEEAHEEQKNPRQKAGGEKNACKIKPN